MGVIKQYARNDWRVWVLNYIFFCRTPELIGVWNLFFHRKFIPKQSTPCTCFCKILLINSRKRRALPYLNNREQGGAWSLVFICLENPRQLGILLFPDCPRFWRLMKTRNRKHPWSSGMDGDKSEESGVFLFSQHVPDFCDGRWSFSPNENSNLYRRGRWQWISLITNSLNCWAPDSLSQICAQISIFGTLSISRQIQYQENLGQTSGDYLIHP